MLFNRSRALVVLLFGALLVAGLISDSTLAGFLPSPLLQSYSLVDMDMVPTGAFGMAFAFALYDSTGTLSTNLIQGCPDSDGAGINDMVVDGQGRVVVAGWALVSGHYQFIVSRFKNGALDPSFGDEGMTLTNFTIGADEAAAAVALDRNHSIVTGGGMLDQNGRIQFALARYRSGGLLDPDFGGGDGKQTTDFTQSTNETIMDIAVDGQNRVVAAGTAKVNGHFQIALARYQSNGTLDSTFGSGGKVLTDLETDDEGAVAVAVLNTGQIVVAAQAGFITDRNLALVFYDAAGRYQGRSLSGFQGTTSLRVNGMAVKGNDIFVAGGLDLGGNNSQFYVGKYFTNGYFDQTFGQGGFALADFAASNKEEAKAIGVDGGGNLIAAGWATVGTEDRFALAKFNARGQLVSSFGSNEGRLLTNLTATTDERIHAVYVDSQWIIAAGLAGTLP